MSRNSRGSGKNGKPKQEKPIINYAAEDQAFLTLYLQEVAEWARRNNKNKLYKNFIRASV